MINSKLDTVYKLLGIVLKHEIPTSFIQNPVIGMSLHQFFIIAKSKSIDDVCNKDDIPETYLDKKYNIVSSSIVHNKSRNGTDELYYQIKCKDGSRNLIYAMQITRNELEYHMMENFNALLSFLSADGKVNIEEPPLISLIYHYIKQILNNEIFRIASSKSYDCLDEDKIMVLYEDDEIHFIPYEYWNENITI